MAISELKQRIQGLSPKQRQVLNLFLDGVSDGKISEELGVGTPTVRKHIQNICDHFGLKREEHGMPVSRREKLLSASSSIKEFLGPLDEDVDSVLSSKIDGTISGSLHKRESLRNQLGIALPSQTNEFVGREEEIKKLLKYISLDYRAPIITIDGIGGVGKTALVLEVAYRCLEARNNSASSRIDVPLFDSIIFTSAKDNRLLPTGIVARPERDSNLQDIFREISRTLGNERINQVTGDIRVQRIYEALSKQRTLLIVDNMETIEDKDAVISFLSDLPSTTKAIITTRERVLLYASLRLNSLPKEDALKLISQQAKQKEVSLTWEEAENLYESIGGVPVALIYVIGQISQGSLRNVTQVAGHLPDQIARFCFDQSLQLIQGKPAHRILMALSMFRRYPRFKSLLKISGFQSDVTAFEGGLAELQQLSLVVQHSKRYKMLPLTHEFASSQLIAHDVFHSEVRERWISWYTDFAKEYGNRDWEEWQIQYDKIDYEWSNLLAVLYWCETNDRYDDVKRLWFELNQFSSLYGYWDERIHWLSWLYKEAERRGDLRSVYYSKVDWAYTLTEMQKLDEAQELLVDSWNHRSFGSESNQVFLAQNIAHLRIKQAKYNKALLWINKAEQLIELADFKAKSKVRREIVNLSRRADALNHLGKHLEAKDILEKALVETKKVGWQRQKNIIRRKLAEMAIARKDYKSAETLLSSGYGETQRNKAKKDIAEYQRAFAYLEHGKGNSEGSHEWANKALNGFVSLGMRLQAHEMQSFWMAT